MENSNIRVKQCPFCAEDIKIDAKKCKHCGEILDVALRAAIEAKSQQSNVYMNAGGGGGGNSSDKRNSFYREGFPHGWHFLLTIVTAGIWIPFWFLMYIFRNKCVYY